MEREYMLLATSKTKNNLVRTVLASGVLISSMTYINAANAATVDVDPANNPRVINAGEDINFTIDGVATVADGINLGKTGGSSAINNAGAAGLGTVQFAGASHPTGTMGVGGDGALKEISFAGTTKVLQVDDAVDVNTLTLTAITNSTAQFDNGLTVHTAITTADNSTLLKVAGAALSIQDNTVASLGKLTTTIVDLNITNAASLTVAGKATLGADLNFAPDANLNTTAVFNGATTVDGATNTTENATLTFNNTVTTTGLVTSDNTSKINFNGAATIDGGIQIDSTSTVNFNANATFGGGVDLTFIGTGTASVLTGKLVNAINDIVTVAGSQFTFDLGNTETAGKFVATGAANITDQQVVNIINANAALVPANTSTAAASIISGANGVVSIPQLNAPNNMFVTYSLTQTAATDINLIITRTTPTGLDGDIAGVAGIIAGLDSGNTTGALTSLVDNLLDISDPEVLNEELAEIAPQGINGSLVDSSFGVTNETFDLFSQRISELRAGLDTYRTGYAAGHMTESGHGTWVKLFGSHADQSRRGNIAGYDGETWGLAAGADMMITDRHLVGVSLAWASTDVNFDSQRGGSDINSYQGAFYGSWNITTPLFVNWMASAAFNKYKETQLINVGGFSQASLGEFDGWQYGARAELGYVFGEECFHITPTADLTYTHVSFDSFQQKGNSTANQIIDYGSVSALLAGVGVKFSYDYEMQKALLQPEVHANVSYDILGEEMDANARFVGFGTAYNVQGASVKRTDYNVGLSLTTYGDSGLGFSISYDYDWKSHFHAHSGFFRIRYEW